MTNQWSRWINFATLLLVNLLWAVQYPAYEIASRKMGVATLNFWTLLMAATLLAPWWLRSRRSTSVTSHRITWRAIHEFSLLGVLGILPPSVMLAWGIDRSSASNAAILSLTIPILMVLMACFMLGEKLTGLRLASLALGLCGTLLISITDLKHVSFDHRVLLGNVIILFAGAGSAFYNTYSKDLLSRYSEVEVLLYSYLVAGLACAVISLAVDRPSFVKAWEPDASTWVAIAVLGLLSWGLAMVLWMWVLNRLEVGQISTSIYLLPVFGVILSVVTVHDQITRSQIMGAVLVLVGTATLTLFERNVPGETMQARPK